MDYRYIKLVKATDSHQYLIEHYNQHGKLITTEPIELSVLDKQCPNKTKLRMTKCRWGLAVFDERTKKRTRILPINEPSFAKVS